MSDMVRIGHSIFRIAAVLGVSAKLRFRAAGLLSRKAIYALPAGGVQPDDAGAVAFLCCLDVPANAGDVPNTLVSRDEGRRRLNGPITFRGVQIGMAYAACLHLDLNFIRTGFWDCHLFDDQGLTKFTNYSRLHILRHFVFPFSVLNALLPGMARISAVLGAPAEEGNQLPQESLQVNNSRSFPIPSANVPPLRDSSDSIVKTSH